MLLTPGDPAPMFVASNQDRSEWRFDSLAGRYLIVCFFGSAADPGSRQVLEAVAAVRHRFNPDSLMFVGIGHDPEDKRLARVPEESNGFGYYWDYNLSVSRAYGAAPAKGASGAYQRHTLVLGPALRTLAVFHFEDDLEAHMPRVLSFLDGLPALDSLVGHAPVLVLPNVFEPQFCRDLIALYEQHGGDDSGFMCEVQGKTVPKIDYSFKRRADYIISDAAVQQAIYSRLQRRLLPQVHKVFQFPVSHCERAIIACYDCANGGHFRPHRDNTTTGTAHRRFAVTINLNAEEYEGGDLRFPEFGAPTYRAPTGGAIVFSCSLMHEVTPVTRGKRFAFLPFLYDVEAARQRDANLKFLTASTPKGQP